MGSPLLSHGHTRRIPQSRGVAVGLAPPASAAVCREPGSLRTEGFFPMPSDPLERLFQHQWNDCSKVSEGILHPPSVPQRHGMVRPPSRDPRQAPQLVFPLD